MPLLLPRRLRPVALGLGLGLASSAGAPAHDGPDHPPAKVPDAAAHRPTAIPDRVILTWTGDPARSQAVTWRIDATVTRAIAQVAPMGSQKPTAAVATPR